MLFNKNRIVSVFLAFILAVAITICGWEQAIAQSIIGPKEEMGEWETIPLAAKENLMQSVHTLLLPNGKVLSVSGSSFRNTVVINNGEPNPTFIEGVNVTDYDVINNTALLDPETGKFERIASPPVQQYAEINDLFCSGHLQLADGNILFVGGTGRYYPGGAFTGSRQVNLYDWKTGKWSAAGQLKEGRWYPSLISLADGKISMNPAKLPRLYHNGAILLPDARILIIGGNANRTAREKDGTLHVDIQRDPLKYYYKFPKLTDKSGEKVKEFNLEEYYQSPQSYFIKEDLDKGDKQPFVPSEIWQAEIFSPPYLFKPGTRPEIVKAPESLNYGKSSSISVKDATKTGSVVLVKLGSVTHSFDYGQRLADLSVENVALGSESAIKFRAPKNANLYPPGYYMMFYLNELGKPSHAKMVKLEV